MLVIFDLDHTLLNTKKLTDEFAKAIGITREFNKKYLKDCFDKRKINFTVSQYLTFLNKKKVITKRDEAKIKKNIKNILKQLDTCVFPKAEKMLEQIQQDGHELMLLSFGNRKWQKSKVDSLSIKKYFKKIVYTEKAKHKILDFLNTKKELVIFINDNAKENLLIQKQMPEARTILVKGPYSSNVKHKQKVYTLKNCLEALELSIVKKKKKAGIKFEVKNENKEIGRAYLYLLKNDLHKRPFGFIEDVEINKEFRGQGIGTKLVKEVIKEARIKNCYKIIMTSRYAKPQVHKLYKKLNFKDWGKEFRINL